MQYSKYVNNSEIVRDEISVAQSICFDDINSENFSHPNITLFLSASLILPVAVAVPSVVIVFKYYTEIERKFINHKSRPSAIGTVITGIYITIYMFCMDIAAVSMYGSNNHEYGEIDTKNEPFSLRWSYATLIVECTVSVLAIFIIIARYTCTSSRWIILCIFIFLLLIFLSTIIFSLVLIFIIISITIFAPPLLFFWSKSNLIMISFLVVPIIFVSAHLDYIFAAWLTEPSKTTSVAILALTIILFLFVMSRTSYSFIKSFMYKRYYATCQTTLKLMDGLAFFITCIFTLAGVALVSLHVAAFFILPIPSVSLADYLENIVQISLVMIASLITYKILSFHESDSSKILKQLTRTNELLTKLNMPSLSPSLEVEASQSESLKAFLKFNSEHISNNIQIDWSSKNTKTAIITLEKAKLFICLPDREEQQKKIKVLTSHVKLHTPPFWEWKTEVHTQLDNAMLELKLEGGRSDVKIFLKGVTLTVGDKTYPTSEIDLRLDFTKETGPVTFAKSKIMCDDNDVTDEASISFHLPCNVIKASMADYHNENSIRFDNRVTITSTPIAPQDTAATPDSATPPDSIPTGDISISMDSAPPDSAATPAPATPQESTSVMSNYVLIDTTSVHLNPDSLVIGSKQIKLPQPATLKLQLHNVTFLYQIPIANREIFTFNYIDENTVMVAIKNIQIKLSIDCLPTMEFLLNRAKFQKNYSIYVTEIFHTENISLSNILDKKEFYNHMAIEYSNYANDIFLHMNFDDNKKSLESSCSNNKNIKVYIERMTDYFLQFTLKKFIEKKKSLETSCSNNKNIKVYIEGMTDSFLQFTFKKSVEINLESNTWHINDENIKVQYPCSNGDDFMKLKPKLIELRDTSFLHFLNGH